MTAAASRPGTTYVADAAQGVGYLDRGDAVLYHPVLDRAAALGFPGIGCRAFLKGGLCAPCTDVPPCVQIPTRSVERGV